MEYVDVLINILAAFASFRVFGSFTDYGNKLPSLHEPYGDTTVINET